MSNEELKNHHIPVMLNEIVEAFAPFKEKESVRYFDGTFGRGGHYSALKKIFPQMIAEVCDQDLQAIEYAKQAFSTEVQTEQLTLHHCNFSEASAAIRGNFEMMLLDLGVSSPQLDQADRGFSFYNDGPLDMRMNQQQEFTAEYMVNTLDEKDLIKVFAEYGEIQRPMRVIRAIINDRKTKAFKTTRELAGLIERVDGWQKKGQHPATRYFMGLRIAVNQELSVVEQALPKLIERLSDGGRLAVLSFHSLEDRIVKTIFKNSESGFQTHKKIIIPTQDECDQNPRSRSAKLRIFQKGSQDDLPRKKKY